MSDKWHGGKGSKTRPVTDQKKFDDNWDKIFGKKDLKFTTAGELINSISDDEGILDDSNEEETQT